MQILNEDFIKSNHIDKIDRYYAQLLNRDNDHNRKKYFKLISDEIKREFNIDCTIKVVNDDNIYMAIYPSNEELEVASKIMTAEYNNKGIHFKDKDSEINIYKMISYRLDSCKDVVMIIGNSFLKGKLKELPKITSRLLTSITLHELGHRISSDYYTSNSLKTLKLTVPVNFLGAIGVILTVQASLPIGLAIIGAVISFTVIMTAIYKSRPNDYEKMADSVAIKYGYGPEIYSFLDAYNKSSYNKSIKSKIDIHSRKLSLESLMKKEMKNASNDYERELIYNQLRNLKKTSKGSELVMEDTNQSLGMFASYLNEGNELRDKGTLLNESNVYEDDHLTSLTQKDCKYLLTRQGLIDVLNGDSEPINQGLELEITVAIEKSDYALLSEINDNLNRAKKRFTKYITEKRFKDYPSKEINLIRFNSSLDHYIVYRLGRYTSALSIENI